MLAKLAILYFGFGKVFSVAHHMQSEGARFGSDFTPYSLTGESCRCQNYDEIFLNGKLPR